MCARCGRPSTGRMRRGVCRKCYRRERRIELGLPVAPPSVEARFDQSYKVDANGCWIWQLAPGSDGYGKFSIDGKQGKAHRYSYERHVGPIPDGLVIDHLCRVPMCVNPTHLEPVTVAENTRRGVALDRAIAAALARTYCKQGHEFTPDNTYIDPRGWRACRTCHRAAVRTHWKKAS